MSDTATRDSVSGYLNNVITEHDAPHNVPFYLGDRRPSTLFIEPRVACLDDSALASQNVDGAHRAIRWLKSQAWFKSIEGNGPKWTSVWKAAGASTDPARLFLIGFPGYGKTTLAKMTAREIAAESLIALAQSAVTLNDAVIPVVLALSELVRRIPVGRESQSHAVSEAIRAYLADHGANDCSTSLIMQSIAGGRAWVILDGLDEAPATKAKNVLKIIAQWSCHLIVTSRVGVSWLPFKAERWVLQGLTPKRVDEFLNKWFANADDGDRLRHVMQRFPRLFQLTRIPIFLSLLCSFAERHRVESDLTAGQILERAIRDALSTRRDDPSVKDKMRGAELFNFTAELMWCCMERRDGRHLVFSDQLLEHMAASQLRPGIQDMHAAQCHKLTLAQQTSELIDELVERRIIAAQRDDRSCFAPIHRFVGDLMAATALARILEDNPEGRSDRSAKVGQLMRPWADWDFIDAKAWRPRWRQMIVFLSGRLADPSPLLSRLTDAKKDDVVHSRIAVAAECLTELSVNHLRKPQAESVRKLLFQSAEDYAAGEIQLLMWQKYPALSALREYAQFDPDAVAKWLLMEDRRDTTERHIRFLTRLRNCPTVVLESTVMAHFVEVIQSNNDRLADEVFWTAASFAFGAREAVEPLKLKLESLSTDSQRLASFARDGMLLADAQSDRTANQTEEMPEVSLSLDIWTHSQGTCESLTAPENLDGSRKMLPVDWNSLDGSTQKAVKSIAKRLGLGEPFELFFPQYAVHKFRQFDQVKLFKQGIRLFQVVASPELLLQATENDLGRCACDPITLAQAGDLVGVRSKTLENKGNLPMPVTPRDGNIPGKYAYKQMRPWLLSHYPNSELPLDYLEARQRFLDRAEVRRAERAKSDTPDPPADTDIS